MKTSDLLRDPIQWKIEFDDYLQCAASLFKKHCTDEFVANIVINALRCVSMAAGVEARYQRNRKVADSLNNFITRQQAKSFVDDIIEDALNDD